MTWLQLKLQTHQDSAELLSDYLTELGAVSVSFQDAEDQPILEPQPGETPLWKNITLTALFEQGSQPLQIQHALNARFDHTHMAGLTFETLEDQDWERAWLDHFRPMSFGQRLWICPSTQPLPDPKAINVLLDPGLAFGTGTHPTTALCLEWLDEQVKPGQSIIDYGCGSGILAIAALKLGCEHAVAIDNDPQALIATKDNAQRNQIKPSQLDILLATETFGQTGPKPDLLVANILATPLIQLAPKIVKLLKPGGNIALSGILSEQAHEVQHTYEALGVKFNPIKNKENWVLLEGSVLLLK